MFESIFNSVDTAVSFIITQNSLSFLQKWMELLRNSYRRDWRQTIIFLLEIWKLSFKVIRV